MIELLSPAGNMRALTAAVQGGADAVYLGGKLFGARSSAVNFAPDELRTAVEYAHIHGVKIYAAVNTLIKDSEFAELGRFVTSLCVCGVDALIVQDTGVVAWLRQNHANIPMHASTQMTIHNVSGIDYAAANGICRVVLPRELSLKEIASLTAYAKERNVETEVFIHGALCYSVSGQCLLSSIIGGRSGNRGKCAQPCRLPYIQEYAGQKAPLNVNHPLSPRDLQSFSHVGKLIDCGVASLKIEGRLKPPEYVYAVTNAYRKAIDQYTAGAQPVFDKNVSKVFNRGFTDDYMSACRSANILSSRRTNNQGEFVGTADSIDSVQLAALNIAREDLFIADVSGVERGLKVSVADGVAVIDALKSLPPAAMIYRVRDSAFEKDVQKAIDSNARKIPVEIFCRLEAGMPLYLRATDKDGFSAEAAGFKAAEIAQKVALTAEKITVQLEKTGGTPFSVAGCNCEIAAGLALPVSEINETRRALFDKLMEIRAANGTKFQFAANNPPFPKRHSRKSGAAAKILIAADTEQSLTAALSCPEADCAIATLECLHREPLTASQLRKLANLAKASDKELYVEFPRIIFPDNYEFFAAWCKELAGLDIAGVYGSIGTEKLAGELGVPLFSGFGLPLYNSFAINAFAGNNYTGGMLSPELNLEQLRQLDITPRFQAEWLAFGALELMTSRVCQIGAHYAHKNGSSCRRGCMTDNCLKLLDRTGNSFVTFTDQFCNMHLFNSKIQNCAGNYRRLLQCGITRLRIDARLLDEPEMRDISAQISTEISGGTIGFFNQVRHSRGHLLRGVD